MLLTDIQVRYWAHKENVRHNLATEELQARSITETERSNRANEALSKERNLIQQQYNEGYLSELSYHNRMTENETKRHNIATEVVQTKQAEASMLSASAAMMNARTQASIAPSVIALNQANTKSANALVSKYGQDIVESRQRVVESQQRTEKLKHETADAYNQALLSKAKAESFHGNPWSVDIMTVIDAAGTLMSGASKMMH